MLSGNWASALIACATGSPRPATARASCTSCTSCQLHEGTSDTVQAELVRLRADNRLLLREIAILRDALRIVASEGISAERGRR